MHGASSFVFPLVIGLAAAACQPNAPIRNIAQACVTADADSTNCASFSLEQDSVPDPKHDHPDQSFLLGFVEFDDQGKPYDRDQITTLFDRIEMEGAARCHDGELKREVTVRVVGGSGVGALESDGELDLCLVANACRGTALRLLRGAARFVSIRCFPASRTSGSCTARPGRRRP